jgi:small-conductance mechanosensitive channel
MYNQCSGLFTCIIDYLHVLCMILILLSCVLCMTSMVFIYVYYGLFICTKLVDVMSLFFMVFLFHLPNFSKNRSVLTKTARNSSRRFSEKQGDLSVKSAAFRCSRFSLFLRRLRCVFSIFTDFYRIFKNPTGSVKSSFPYSTKYLNTDPNSQVHDGINVEFVA